MTKQILKAANHMMETGATFTAANFTATAELLGLEVPATFGADAMREMSAAARH